MTIELVILSNHLILCCPLPLLPSIPSMRVFSSELTLHISFWPFICEKLSTWLRLYKEHKASGWLKTQSCFSWSKVEHHDWELKRNLENVEFILEILDQAEPIVPGINTHTQECWSHSEKGHGDIAAQQEREFFHVKLSTSLVAQMVKNLPTMQETLVWSLGWEDSLKKEMVTHLYFCLENSLDRGAFCLQSMGRQGVRHNWACTHI